MAHSLEVRVPLLDFRLVEFVASLPGSFKRPFPRPKALLLDALGNDLPDSVRHRRKMGFTFPFAPWLRGALRWEVETTLLDSKSGGQMDEALSASGVRAIWERFLAGQSHWTKPWSLYVVKKWAARHLG